MTPKGAGPRVLMNSPSHKNMHRIDPSLSGKERMFGLETHTATSEVWRTIIRDCGLACKTSNSFTFNVRFCPICQS